MEQNLYTRVALLLTATSIIGSNASAQCHYIPATSASGDTVAYSHSGGSFQSFGCAPIDPTYWMSGAGMWITATFAVPTDHPVIRVWGMNDDDVAAVSVNGAAYPLDGASATIAPKVVCGLSPGPDGVAFIGGNVTGANDNAEGNYSYNDITLNVDDVNSITITGLSGAGWGFAGVLVDCTATVEEITAAPIALFPNPTDGPLTFSPMNGVSEVMITDATGRVVHRAYGAITSLDLSGMPDGCYAVTIVRGDQRSVSRIVKR